VTNAVEKRYIRETTRLELRLARKILDIDAIQVRCDAPTEADGTPKTCSNCSKAGVTCDFERKPMKRGPSKGQV
jgi:hypothetical protein